MGMSARISVSELSRDLSSVLAQIQHSGDSFVIEQDGQAIAELGPPRRAAAGISLAEVLRHVPPPDPAFASDLEEIQRHQPRVPLDLWRN